jgi:autotransporter-associated beta strand protein
LDASGSGAINWTSTTSPSYGTVNQTRTLVLSGTNTGDNTLAANIADNGTGAVSLIKSNTGTWVLSGASTYTGTTTIKDGVLVVTTMANGGANSSIGASASAASNLILTNGATLRYTGTGHTSDRGFTIGGTAAGGSGVIQASGSGALNLTGTTSPAYGTANQARTLVLGGTSTDANTLAANIANNGSGLVSLVKSNAGTWVLSGASTYTGATEIKGGILRVTGSLASPTVTVNSGGTLAGTGTMAAKIQGAGSVDPGSSPGILTANQLDPSGGLSFNFEFSALTPTYTLPTSSGNDVLRLTNSTTPFLANLTLANVVNVYIATGVIPTPGSQQTYQGGFFTDRSSDFINSITNATFNVYLQDASGSTVYNGVNYRFHGAPVEVRTVDSGFTFTGGANGWVMEFDVMNAIPEPSTVFLFVCGLLLLKRYGRRRS